MMRLILLSALISVVASASCPTGCSCRNRYVDCSGRRHTTMPDFSSLGVASNYDTLDMRNNNLTTLDNASFVGAPFETVYLSHNNLADRFISAGAFEGLVDSVKILDLGFNNIQKLPTALKELNMVEELDVSHNPMRFSNSFPADIMRAMGDTITAFTFGNNQLVSWPESLNHFVQLQKLHVDQLGSFMQVLTPEAFHGFETTLLYLKIENTNLIAVPIGISKLKNLEELHFDDNPQITDKGVLIQSFPLKFEPPKLRIVSLDGDGLTKFPPVLKYLRALDKLSLDRNLLDFLSDASIEGNVTATELSLVNCGLDRIPGALSDLHYLTHLDLSQNDIKTIEHNDLENLPTLEQLVIQNASLEYISNNAFAALHHLVSLDLRLTNLKQVPIALNLMHPCPAKVDLIGNKVDCMCETLVWLATKTEWCQAQGSPMDITGDCDTIDSTVKNYVAKYIPNCPQYKVDHNIAPYNHG
eukprot:XP_011448489.1 PREDICTED: leucine-rich repeats and immunoglobulin-like domains protein 3 [Crassostrea gigas]